MQQTWLFSGKREGEERGKWGEREARCLAALTSAYKFRCRHCINNYYVIEKKNYSWILWIVLIWFIYEKNHWIFFPTFWLNQYLNNFLFDYEMKSCFDEIFFQLLNNFSQSSKHLISMRRDFICCVSNNFRENYNAYIHIPLKNVIL